MNLSHYYYTTRCPAPGLFGRRPAAEVLPASFQGKWVALTIRIRGSAWICHPRTEGDDWCRDSRSRPERPGERPPRHVRKAAKLALLNWLRTEP